MSFLSPVYIRYRGAWKVASYTVRESDQGVMNIKCCSRLWGELLFRRAEGKVRHLQCSTSAQ